MPATGVVRRAAGATRVPRVPLRRGVHIIGYYDVREMLHKFGNGDGEDQLMARVARYIMGRVERETGLKIVTLNTIHNAASIYEVRDEAGKTVWENRDWHRGATPETYNSLPVPVKKVIEKIAHEGVDVDRLDAALPG